MQNTTEENERQDKGGNPTPQESQNHFAPNHRPLIGGIIVILVGLGLLLNKIPGINEFFPSWLFTWPMILIIVGIFAGIKNRSVLGGAIPFLIGLFFLLNNQHIINTDFQPYLFPALIILFGIFLVLHRHKKEHLRNCRHRHHLRHQQRWARHQQRYQGTWPGQEGTHPHNSGKSEAHFSDTFFSNDEPQATGEDYLDLSVIFGSNEKNYFSKNFKGGNITCVFGGGKINLTQSDIKDTAILNCSITFGGAEIILPSNWKVQNELTAIFGGIEDKRQPCPMTTGTQKVLILRGNVFCGGIELRS